MAATTDGAGDGEALPPPSSGQGRRKRGGWITTPFIIASVGGQNLALGGSLGNLIVFLIRQFHISSVDAAQISNVVSGSVSIFPLIAAILADSFLGCFTVIWIFSLVTSLGMILMVTTTLVPSLRPPTCEAGSLLCAAPTTTQYAVLFTAVGLVVMGGGGTRFTLATIGADQFTKSNHKSTYFNCYFFTFFLSSSIASTLLFYIEDNWSWSWGLGIATVANVLGISMFLMGRQYYLSRGKPAGSPLTGLAQVVVASFRKRKVEMDSQSAAEYYSYGDNRLVVPTKSLRFLNRAAVTTREDILPDGSIAQNTWKLCSVEQVEDLKSVIRILPLWSSSIFLCTPIGIQLSLAVLQALSTNRHLGHSFQMPPGSIIVVPLLTSALCLTLFDHCLWPLWRKVTGKDPTPLQQVGISHLLAIASMVVSALVEARRRRQSREMSVLWLFPQMVMQGVGEAFQAPGLVALFYQEFPSSLKAMATAMVSLVIAVGFYMSTGVLDMVRRITWWLPDNIDEGRVDRVYWVMVGIGALNFAYFLVCCWFYEYKNGSQGKNGHSDDDGN